MKRTTHGEAPQARRPMTIREAIETLERSAANHEAALSSQLDVYKRKIVERSLAGIRERISNLVAKSMTEDGSRTRVVFVTRKKRRRSGNAFLVEEAMPLRVSGPPGPETKNNEHELSQKEEFEDVMYHIDEAKRKSKRLGYDNIFYNERYKEIEMALKLGHTPMKVQGADAINEKGESCEYKTIFGYKNYFQYHWLSQEKTYRLMETPHHYFAVYDKDTQELKEIYYLHISKIIDDIYEAYEKGERKRKLMEQSGEKKDKNIDAHCSFSLRVIKERGGELVYSKD